MNQVILNDGNGYNAHTGVFTVPRNGVYMLTFSIAFFVLLIVPSRYFCVGSLFCVLVFKIFLCCWRLMYVFIFLVKETEWPPIGKTAAHSAYEMFLWYKYLIVSLVFPTSVFGVGIFF